jgi:hypothetical protein
MTEKNIDIEKLLPWGAPRKVRLQDGTDRILRTSFTVPASFWDAWKQNKETLRAAGIAPKRQSDGSWVCNWWAHPDPMQAKADQEKRAVAVEASRAITANLEVPCPPGLAYLPFQKAGIAFILNCWGRA